jgi:error-prone DNA polymerase
MGFYSPAVIAGDAKRHGIAILPVDVNASQAKAIVELCDTAGLAVHPRDFSNTIAARRKCREHDVRLGFESVKGLGAAEAKGIVDERDRGGSFHSFDEFARRVGLKEEALRNLALLGAFDAFGKARRELLWRARDAHRTSPAFTRPALALPTSDAPVLPALTEQERVALDYRITGIPTGPQIMRFYRADLDGRGVLATAALAGGRHGAVVRVAGAIVVKQHPETAKGHVFLSLEDETGMANVIIRPSTYRQYKRVLDANAAVVVTGSLQTVDGVISVLASRLDGLALFVKIAAREWQ